MDKARGSALYNRRPSVAPTVDLQLPLTNYRIHMLTAANWATNCSTDPSNAPLRRRHRNQLNPVHGEKQFTTPYHPIPKLRSANCEIRYRVPTEPTVVPLPNVNCRPAQPKNSGMPRPKYESCSHRYQLSVLTITRRAFRLKSVRR